MLTRKDWDSSFFGREIYSLGIESISAEDELNLLISQAENNGAWAIECNLKPDFFDYAVMLENCGFRLVDSRVEFLSFVDKSQLDLSVSPPFGLLRCVEQNDLAVIRELIIEGLVDNPKFFSRFKNLKLFTRDETINYFNAWIEKTFNESPELFCVWEVDGKVVSFFNFLEYGYVNSLPLYKGILTAVSKNFQGYRAQNFMQSFLFGTFPVDQWALESTTQLVNTAVIKNHIKSQKSFKESILTFYFSKGLLSA